MKTQFYHFNQNNSGGYFVRDDEYGICEDVIIEAESPKAAWKKLVSIGDNVSGFFDYCNCCGERWNNWLDESDGKDTPQIYGEPVEILKKELFRESAFVHYIDGTFKKFIFKSE